MIFAEMPKEVIIAVVDTEYPRSINRKGSVTVAKPPLIPYGKTRKKNINGLESVCCFLT